jgi:hypothetical protein
MSDAEFDEAGFEWAYYVRMSHAFKVNLRHLFSELTSPAESKTR